MDERSKKIFLVCFIWAGIGALIALGVNRYFWWLGLLVGGIGGYLSYEFKAVLAVIPVAWKKAKGWRPGNEWWRFYGQCIVAVICFVPTLTLTMMLTIDGSALMSRPFLENIIILVGMSVFLIVICMISMGIAYAIERPDEDDRKAMRFAMKRLNLFYLLGWLLPKYALIGIKYVLVGAWWMLTRIPTGCKVVRSFVCMIGRFLWHLFKLIHSELRLLCGVDAILGAFVGFCYGNVLIGALAGGIIGVINFEIVSKRILRVAKAPAK